MDSNFESVKLQKCNIPTVRVQKVDERNGAICLINMSTLGVMVIKMSKMTHYWWQQKISAPERPY